MKKSLLVSLFIGSFITVIAQTDTTTIYKGLEIKKFYSINAS